MSEQPRTEPDTSEWAAHGHAAMDELRRLYFEGSEGQGRSVPHPGHITVSDWDSCEDAIRRAITVLAIEREVAARPLDVEALARALPHKRWRISIDGDWEDGWVASAESWLAGGGDVFQTTTEGSGWGADRNGAPTPDEALHRLVAKIAALSQPGGSDAE